jgi:hypothetical protein
MSRKEKSITHLKVRATRKREVDRIRKRDGKLLFNLTDELLKLGIEKYEAGKESQ